MGTSHMGGQSAETSSAVVHHFYSQKSWIEGKATEQLEQVARLRGVHAVAAFPDLHPGKFGPVGCAILSDRLYPHLIGNDIGCGMSLFALDLEVRKLRLDKAAQKIRDLEGEWTGPSAARLLSVGLPSDLHPHALGTIGGGNHFCELQVVEDLPGDLATAPSLSKGQLVLLVHSGSRSFGPAVFDTVIEHVDGLDRQSREAERYLALHDQAVGWAALNRQVIAERAAFALKAEAHLIADVPHNLVEEHEGRLLHRKGAARAKTGLVPIAGSRDTASYVVKPGAKVHSGLQSLAHGSGRKYDRSSMIGRAGKTRSDRDALTRNASGGFIICEDRQLLIEEAPQAYKPSRQVLDDLASFGLADPVATLRPLLTYKKSASEDASRPKSKPRDKDRRLRT